MAVRSLNKVQLIGNLTRDPELRYTPSGTAVCTFTVATNRQWTTDSGERREAADFHRAVAWRKLAELCSQLMSKGRKVYVEGRIKNRSYEDQSGQKKYITEIVVNDMILLDSRGQVESDTSDGSDTTDTTGDDEATGDEAAVGDEDSEDTPEKQTSSQASAAQQDESAKVPSKENVLQKKQKKENVNPDDIPF